jgi:hypothetical protein
MKIACLGWGSLIWRPGNLLIQRKWFNDGPLLPVEFVRKSDNGRLTLVITETAKPVRTLWALMTTDNIEIAKTSLRIREGIPKEKLSTWIGSLTVADEITEDMQLIIKNWAIGLKLDAVIWTTLPSKFNNLEGHVPTIDEAISYLRSVDINTWETAQEYVRRTPKQIDTEFRRRFEGEFGWTCIE